MGATEDLFKDDAPVVYKSRKEKSVEEVFDPNGNLIRRNTIETEEEETRPFEPEQQTVIQQWPTAIGDLVPLTPVTCDTMTSVNVYDPSVEGVAVAAQSG